MEGSSPLISCITVHYHSQVNLASHKEALVVCSDNNLTTGITIWDINTGEELSHRPTCASPPHGLVCLGHQFLVAAQVQKPGSYRGGAIFIWALNKVWCDMVLCIYFLFSL